MPARVRCPTCDTPLTAPDDLLGSTVRCEACGQQFVAKAPPSRRRLDDEFDDRPARRRYADDDEDDDDDDDRPIRRRRVRPRRRTAAAPFVFAGLVFVGLAAAIGGLLWHFTKTVKKVTPPIPAFAAPAQPPLPAFAQPPAVAQPTPQPQPPAGQKVVLSNPRWGGMGPPGSFQVDYAFANGQRPFGGFLILVVKQPDGSIGKAPLHFLNASGTIPVTSHGRFGQPQGPIEMWMTEGGVPGPFGPEGTPISNRVTLN